MGGGYQSSRGQHHACPPGASSWDREGSSGVGSRGRVATAWDNPANRPEYRSIRSVSAWDDAWGRREEIHYSHLQRVDHGRLDQPRFDHYLGRQPTAWDNPAHRLENRSGRHMSAWDNAWGRYDGTGYSDTPHYDQFRQEQARYEQMRAPRFEGSDVANLRAIRVPVDENQKIGAVGIEDFRLPIGENVDLDNVEQTSLDIQLGEEEDGFLKVASLSPMSRHEALECIQIESAIREKITNGVVKAIVPRLGKLEVLGVHKGDADAINALAKPRRIWTEIGSIDARNIAPPWTNGLSAAIVFIDIRKYCVFDPGGLAVEAAIMGIDEETFLLTGLELIDGVFLMDQHAICASIKDMLLENGSIGKVEKAAASFNDARVSSYDVEDGCVKQRPVAAVLVLVIEGYLEFPEDGVTDWSHRSYGFAKDEIARLFIAGFGYPMVLGSVAGSLDDQKGRKRSLKQTVSRESSPKSLFVTLFIASWFPP